MYPLSLLRDNRPLTAAELELARRIGSEMIEATAGRDTYMRRHRIDVRFALPDANWSYDAPNEFVRLFKRVAAAAADDIRRFRGFTQVFSGYNLFEVADGYGLSAADVAPDDYLDEKLERRLRERNEQFVQLHQLQIAGLPPEFVFRPPALLGEIGELVDGVIVNHDTNAYQERINILVQSGLVGLVQSRLDAGRDVKVCEIGGGYGALCHWFRKTFPRASYTIIDLPESLLFSRMYVSLTLPDTPTSCGLAAAPGGVRFVPNYMAEQLDDAFDLVINTLSMSEMSEYQVRKYVELLCAGRLRDDGVLFEQNHDVRGIGLLFAQEILASEFEYHIPLYPQGANYVTGFPYKHGFPSAWSLKPLDLAPWAVPLTSPIRYSHK